MPWPGARVRRIALLASCFVFSRLLYWGAGVRFDASSLNEFMQYLDPVLLRERLLESLFYLHIQPPLFNAFLGVGLKLDPDSTWFFPSCFFLAGFLLYASTDALMRRMGVSPRIALSLSTAFMASPGFVLWEHFLLYEFLCAALLAATAVLVFDYAREGRPRQVALAFACVVGLAGMRSLFHWAYVALVLAGVLAARPRHWRPTLAAGLLALALVGLVYVKNYAVFGEFTACTFVDKNLWIMTAGNIGWEEKQRLVAEGRLSPLALTNRWAGLDAYPEEYATVPERFRHVPALSEAKKSNGAVNYNHIGHIAICGVYGEDARAVLRDNPRAYAAAVAMSAYRYFAPVSSPPVSPQNKAAMPWMLALYDRVLLLKAPDALRDAVPFFARGGIAPHFTLLIGLPLLVVFGSARLFRTLWLAGPRGWCSLDASTVLLAFMLFNIAVVAILGCALDFHETARYRFLTNAFYLTLAGMLLQRLVTLRRAPSNSGE